LFIQNLSNIVSILIYKAAVLKTLCNHHKKYISFKNHKNHQYLNFLWCFVLCSQIRKLSKLNQSVVLFENVYLYVLISSNKVQTKIIEINYRHSLSRISSSGRLTWPLALFRMVLLMLWILLAYYVLRDRLTFPCTMRLFGASLDNWTI